MVCSGCNYFRLRREKKPWGRYSQISFECYAPDGKCIREEIEAAETLVRFSQMNETEAKDN